MLVDVVVDVGAWELDHPLTYSVPEKYADLITLGSVVRVTLRNRPVRGWVVSTDSLGGEPREAMKILPIKSVSGKGPVFDAALLEMARALAARYVHPLSSFLSLFTPPRVGRPSKTMIAAARTRKPAGRGGKALLMRLGAGEDAVKTYEEEIRRCLEGGSGAIVAVPEVREGSVVLQRLADALPDDAAVVHSGLDPKERSDALWEVGAGKRRLVLGGRAAMFAPPFDLGLIIVHNEHDRSFKDQRSPYVDAREAALQRGRAGGADVILASPTPSLASFAHFNRPEAFEEPDRAGERSRWPVVELVERTGAMVPRRAVAAIIEARRRSAKTLVLLPRAQRSRAGPGPSEVAYFISRVVPDAKVSRVDRPSLGDEPGALGPALEADVVVATEAALAEIRRPELGLVVALDIDAYLQRPSTTAVEEAFASLWSLGCLVAGKSPRGRMLIETDSPQHHLVQALTRGSFRYFAERELAYRKEAEAPPFRSIVRLGVNGEVSGLMDRLQKLPGTTVLGPVPGGRLGTEFLLKAEDAGTLTGPLGTIVREAENRILVEMDPRD
ncbi:MAG: hypothetical protein ACRDIU_08025 [Actinomycetota bacterium]